MDLSAGCDEMMLFGCLKSSDSYKVGLYFYMFVIDFCAKSLKNLHFKHLIDFLNVFCGFPNKDIH